MNSDWQQLAALVHSMEFWAKFLDALPDEENFTPEQFNLLESIPDVAKRLAEVAAERVDGWTDILIREAFRKARGEES